MPVIRRSSTEASVLSTCLNNLDESWISHVARFGGKSPETLFASDQNEAVFTILYELVSQGKSPSIPLVEDMLKDRYEGIFDSDDDVEDYLRQIILVPSLQFDSMETALDDLKEARQQRRTVRSLEILHNDIEDEDVTVSSEDITERLKSIIDDSEVSHNLQTFAEMAQEILDSPAAMWRQSTGISCLDEVLGGKGFESGTLTTVAARPKVGKTAFMNNMIYVTLDSGNYPLVFNYETKKIEFMAKMISRHIGDPHLGWGKIKAYLSKEEEVVITPQQDKSIQKGIEWSLEQDWYVNFDKTTLQQEITATVAKVKAEVPEDVNVMVFVDYLQLMVTDNMNAVAQISDLTRFFKLLATTYDVAVVLLSQLNRDAGDGKPRVWQMRGSGSIEQDSDVILLLDSPSRRKESSDKGILEIDANTSRLATGGDLELKIDGATQMISESPVSNDEGEYIDDLLEDDEEDDNYI